MANPKMTETAETCIGRRSFLTSTAGGLGFLLGFAIDGSTRASKAAGLTAAQTAINAYIQIATDESITIFFGGCEMGQGAMSGLAQIAAEELMVDWNQIKIETALASSISYITGGSSAVRGKFATLQNAGACARVMLIAAAAQGWGVPTSECYAQSAKVYHKPTGRVMTYGALALTAAGMPAPTNPPLTPPANYRLMGTTLPRLDIPDKVSGKTVYGMDVRLPDMVYAVVRHCPTIGGTLTRTPTKPAGAIAVVPLKAPENRGAIVAGSLNAVAVVADNTWSAWKMAKQMAVAWTLPSNASQMTDATILSQAQQLMATGTGIVAESKGDVDAAFAGATTILDYTYSFPYLAHATLEPMCCTATVTSTSCEVWAPTQAAAWVVSTASAITGLTSDKIIVHTTFLGGGLGRKIEQDYISQAIQISKAIGRPVKLFWPREEDFQHDQYRPMALVRIKAGIDSAGNIVAWYSRNVSPSILGQRGWIGPGTVDTQATEGLTALPYTLGTTKCEWVPHTAAVPVGFWRSVGHSINAYAVECMIDEIAATLKLDAIQYRKQLLTPGSRAWNVVDAADKMTSWRFSLAAGHAWNASLAESFGTSVCQVVDCSGATGSSISVNKVAIAVDCGFAVNPGSVEAQMQGGMVHGLSSALWGKIPFTNGVSQVKNFSSYRELKLQEMPQVTVKVVNSGTTPTGGTGEPATPGIGPAVSNAYFKLTGNRIRTLPMFPSAGRMGE